MARPEVMKVARKLIKEDRDFLKYLAEEHRSFKRQ